MTELEFEKAARTTPELGIVDLVGSRWERAVTVGNSEGRRFRGTHGLGFLDALGQPWPS
jgi:hypothetical protein